MFLFKTISGFIGGHLRAISIYFTKRNGRTYREIYNEVTDPDLEDDDDLGRFTNGCVNYYYGLFLFMALLCILIMCTD